MTTAADRRRRAPARRPCGGAFFESTGSSPGRGRAARPAQLPSSLRARRRSSGARERQRDSVEGRQWPCRDRRPRHASSVARSGYARHRHRSDFVVSGQTSSSAGAHAAAAPYWEAGADSRQRETDVGRRHDASALNASIIHRKFKRTPAETRSCLWTTLLRHARLQV